MEHQVPGGDEVVGLASCTDSGKDGRGHDVLRSWVEVLDLCTIPDASQYPRSYLTITKALCFLGALNEVT